MVILLSTCMVILLSTCMVILLSTCMVYLWGQKPTNSIKYKSYPRSKPSL